MFKKTLEKLVRKEDLSPKEAEEVMTAIARGEAEAVQTAAFLALLASKGETYQEIASLATVMRKYAVKPLPESYDVSYLVDIVGTGGKLVFLCHFRPRNATHSTIRRRTQHVELFDGRRNTVERLRS